jgi:hypothetical protein
MAINVSLNQSNLNDISLLKAKGFKRLNDEDATKAEHREAGYETEPFLVANNVSLNLFFEDLLGLGGVVTSPHFQVRLGKNGRKFLNVQVDFDGETDLSREAEMQARRTYQTLATTPVWGAVKLHDNKNGVSISLNGRILPQLRAKGEEGEGDYRPLNPESYLRFDEERGYYFEPAK